MFKRAYAIVLSLGMLVLIFGIFSHFRSWNLQGMGEVERVRGYYEYTSKGVSGRRIY